MTALAWNVVANTAKEILAADVHRDEYVIQLQEQQWPGMDPIHLVFGSVAEDTESMRLGGIGDTVRVLGAKARLAVSALSTATASGGIETMTSIEYRHVLNYPAWWNWQNPKT